MDIKALVPSFNNAMEDKFYYIQNYALKDVKTAVNPNLFCFLTYLEELCILIMDVLPFCLLSFNSNVYKNMSTCQRFEPEKLVKKFSARLVFNEHNRDVAQEYKSRRGSK